MQPPAKCCGIARYLNLLRHPAAVAAAAAALSLQGIFVGALLSMSSTSVVVKCLDSLSMNGTAFGQIVIGTLILQVGVLGLAGAGSGLTLSLSLVRLQCRHSVVIMSLILTSVLLWS